MTTIAANNLKSEQVAFPELYTFTTGSVVFRYTSWHTDLVVSLNTYVSRPIKRGIFSQDSQMGKTTVDITAPVLSNLTQFISSSPIEPTTVTIVRVSGDDVTQQIILFTGQIMGVSFSERTASVRCEANSDKLNIIIPRFVHKPTCNHRLFDTGCGLNTATYTHVSTVSSVNTSGLTMNLVIAGLNATGRNYNGGYVIWGNDQRMITKQTTDTIYLHVSFYGILSAAAVSVVPGCSGTIAACTAYSNLPRFLGMTTVPFKNPTLYGV